MTRWCDSLWLWCFQTDCRYWLWNHCPKDPETTFSMSGSFSISVDSADGLSGTCNRRSVFHLRRPPDMSGFRRTFQYSTQDTRFLLRRKVQITFQRVTSAWKLKISQNKCKLTFANLLSFKLSLLTDRSGFCNERWTYQRLKKVLQFIFKFLEKHGHSI